MTSTQTATTQARFNMIEQQIRPWEVLDPQVLALLDQVKREDFAPAAHKALAFTDMALPLTQPAVEGQAMLPPRVEARLLQEAAVQQGAGNRHWQRPHGCPARQAGATRGDH